MSGFFAEVNEKLAELEQTLTERFSDDTDRRIFLREVLNTAAVKGWSIEYSSGGSSPYHAGVMQGAALALAADGEGTTDSLIYGARIRAVHLFQSGQDWRRECELYDNLVRRFG